MTTAAATEILDGGGNAFDAVVAAGFASSVAEPMLTSLAGGGFCLVREPNGTCAVVDFFVDVPGRGRAGPPPSMTTVEVAFVAAIQEFHGGWGSVAVPGCLTGFLHLHRTRGRLPLAHVLAPAIRAAEGVVVNDQQAYLFRILAPMTALTPATAARFVPGGHPLCAGDVLRQHDVGAFLADLGRDPDEAVARFDDALVQACRAEGGAVTVDDLAAHQVVERPPLAAPIGGGAAIHTNPAPGGRLVASALARLHEGGALRGWGDAEGVVRIVDAQRRATADRPVEEPTATQGTTQVTVADAEGNVASMTTSNGTGSGCTLPGIGVVCNNMLGEDDLFPAGLGTGTPGARIASMMSPSVVERDGAVLLALGSGGSKRIRTALTQVIARFLDHEPDLVAAVAGPRVHHDGEMVQVEPGLGATAMETLAAAYPVNPWATRDLYFGGVHAVVPARDGHGARAAGDPRRGGSVALPGTTG